jgi:hypothetical protein
MVNPTLSTDTVLSAGFKRENTELPDSEVGVNSDSVLVPEAVLADVGANASTAVVAAQSAKEIGGRGGLEPTRYGDWEKNGRCIDF